MAVGVVAGGTNVAVAHIDGDGSVGWLAYGTPSQGFLPLRSTLLPDGTLIVEASTWPDGHDRYLGFRGSDGALLWDVPGTRDGQPVASNSLGVAPDGRLLLGTYTLQQGTYVVGLASIDATGQIEDHGVTTLPQGSALNPMLLRPDGSVFLLRTDPVDPGMYHVGRISADAPDADWHPVALPVTHPYHTLYDNGTDLAILSFQNNGAEMRHEIRRIAEDGSVRWLKRLGPELAQVPRFRFVYGPRDITFVQNVARNGDPFDMRIRATRFGVPLHVDDFETPQPLP